MASGNVCTIGFDDQKEKARAFFELVHSRTSFSGIGKDALVVTKDACDLLESKDIKFKHLD